MTYLIIDTSSNFALIALSNQGAIVDWVQIFSTKDLSRSALPAIQDLLHKNHIDKKALDFIAVGVGPGSYTGTRVGAIIAQSMGFALKKPLIRFCSLLWAVPLGPCSFWSLFPNKSDHLFSLNGNIGDDRYIRIYQEKMLSPEEISSLLTDTDQLFCKEREKLPSSFTPYLKIEASVTDSCVPIFLEQQFKEQIFEKKEFLPLIYLH
ncbi:MAG: tRNA (adenosine(37)-N6)-threonylcarbamoyltransferase complex dimerization subunit type 1 TsaB [Rhabdochlamydiaceae bacterium]